MQCRIAILAVSGTQLRLRLGTHPFLLTLAGVWGAMSCCMVEAVYCGQFSIFASIASITRPRRRCSRFSMPSLDLLMSLFKLGERATRTMSRDTERGTRCR